MKIAEDQALVSKEDIRAENYPPDGVTDIFVTEPDALTVLARLLRPKERSLLSLLEAGEWVEEQELQRRLLVGRLRFFLLTARLTALGIIDAKRAGSFFRSAYRINPALLLPPAP